jgi:hypothetical protein
MTDEQILQLVKEHFIEEEVKKMTKEELQELLNGKDFYELLRKAPDPEAKAYIDKIWMNAIYGKRLEQLDD